MTKSEALENIEIALQGRISQLWNYDSYFELNKKETEEIIEAARELLGIELENPWEKP